MSTTSTPTTVRPLPGSLLGLAGFGLLCAAVALGGSLFTTPFIAGWYADLRKPDWVPPNAAFGIVWPVLFALMAVAGWLVWRRPPADRLALALFGVQLALNLAWSALFFTLHQVGLALVEVVVLWLAILATIIAFARTSRLAAALLVPYLLWVGFATALNFAIWRLN